ncbi:MAG: prephenate dehydrogenase [Proteobacteria bacterium]|nr:MAG: prephenate dehydrogenase [Pseudomonadota bacterium]
MTLIMGHSVREQNKLHESKRSGSAPSLKNALVIGGLGRMGRWFSQYFQSIGFQVSIHDIKSEETPENYSRHLDLNADLDRFEVILLTTPIAATQSLLEALAKQKVKALIIETSSLKTPVLKGLKALRESGAKVASIHPMFGPDTDLLVDKNILICRGEGLSSEEAAALYFHSTSADLVTIDIDQHDRDMLSTLGLTHFVNLLFGISLSEQSLPIDQAKMRGGSTFLEQFETTRSLFSENHELYFDIQALNPYSAELYQKFRKVLDRLEQLVQTKDKKGFLNELNRADAVLQKTL